MAHNSKQDPSRVHYHIAESKRLMMPLTRPVTQIIALWAAIYINTVKTTFRFWISDSKWKVLGTRH